MGPGEELLRHAGMNIHSEGTGQKQTGIQTMGIQKINMLRTVSDFSIHIRADHSI